MSAPYLLRLVCLSLVSFFLVNALAGLLASLASQRAIRIVERTRARSAARFLLGVRLLGPVLGIAIMLRLCVPSYLRFEPLAESERMGWLCLALAACGASGWMISIIRAVRAGAKSVRLTRMW